MSQRFKPDVAPCVDDGATVILEYPAAVAVSQTSWEWPFDRESMDVRGRLVGAPKEPRETPALEVDFPGRFAAVVRAEVKPVDSALVVESPDAARRSAAEGRSIRPS